MDDERIRRGFHTLWRDPVAKTIAAGVLLYVLIAAEADAPAWLTIAYLVGPVFFCGALVVFLRVRHYRKSSRTAGRTRP